VYGADPVFESDPLKLKKQIDLWSKQTLDKYEHLDLSGNPQPNFKPRKKRWLKK
jgi:hypothetical protein